MFRTPHNPAARLLQGIPAMLGALLLVLMAAGVTPGCSRSNTPQPATGRKAPTVASLVPAATDLLVGMGAADHLVAISNYCPPRPETNGLPKAGDYQTIDWELLAELRPALLITQFNADKMPDGLAAKAKQYGIQLVNVRIVRLEEVFSALAQIGQAVNEPAKAAALAARLRQELDDVKKQVAGQPPVRTYLSRTGNPLEAVGGGNFLDDLLTIAGGQNVLAGPGYDYNSFPTIDRETLLAASPAAVLNLLPAASAQVQSQARDFWSRTTGIPAAGNNRIHYLTDDDLLLPGANVGRTAQRFAAKLHPDVAANAARSDGLGGTGKYSYPWCQSAPEHGQEYLPVPPDKVLGSGMGLWVPRLVLKSWKALANQTALGDMAYHDLSTSRGTQVTRNAVNPRCAESLSGTTLALHAGDPCASAQPASPEGK